ncbi:MAG TPA: hypothetical protein VN958_18905 [Chitinophagaceae bacterium]|jgi:hypothetical protein|nr:hypothetical protein [Chitinophagaceae bacterium]
MKKEHTLFESLFGGGKIDEPSRQVKSTPVTITAYSQPHVLQQRMREEKMTHGQTVTAHLSPVRLEMNHGHMVMYFCPMKSIQVLGTIAKGDGGSIPDDAKVDGLTVPGNCRPGFYTLKNVELTSNGTMQVKATEKTMWEHAEL